MPLYFPKIQSTLTQDRPTLKSSYKSYIPVTFGLTAKLKEEKAWHVPVLSSH